MEYKTCKHCKKILPDDFPATLCERCAKKNAERARRYYAERKEKGICTVCGKVKVENGVVCEKCKNDLTWNMKKWRQDHPNYQKEYRKKLREKGLCPQCHSVVTDEKFYCEKCREKQNAYHREYNKRKRAKAKENALYDTLEV